LEVALNIIAPEEASFVRGVKVWKNVVHKGQVRPPVFATVLEHASRSKPDRTSTKVREDYPASEKDGVVNRC